jgi:hypothetical protein
MSPRTEGLENKFIKIVPGPGAYTPASKNKDSFAYSFGLKPTTDFHHKYHSQIPGPGNYDDKARKTFSTLGASLDRGSKADALNKTQAIVPGPGRYQPTTNDIIAKNYSPKYGFGTGGRPDLATGAPSSLSKRSLSDGKGHSSSPTLRLIVPGPGTYDIKQIVGNDGPKKSLAGRFKVDLVRKELDYKPGPAQYSPSASFS